MSTVKGYTIQNPRKAQNGRALFCNGQKLGKFCLENRTKSLQSGPLVVQFLIFSSQVHKSKLKIIWWLFFNLMVVNFDLSFIQPHTLGKL